jgi:hypothetical protein
MKTRVRCVLAGIVSLLVVLPSALSGAATTIDETNRFGYGATVGWFDWFAGGSNGVVIGDYVCSGYEYCGNVGWIDFGNGNPTNGTRYQNVSSSDFGVNQDGFGNLRGYAYGANIGWINFENIGNPHIDLRTGIFSGYAWSANVGWISLSNAIAYVQTDKILPGQLDSNGLPYAWELTYFSQTGINPDADSDGDGASNYSEYLAGTNPTNAADFLRITSTTFSPGGTNTSLTWSSTPSRLYSIQKTLSLTNIWADSGLGFISPAGGATTTATFNDSSAPIRYFRIQAVSPLAP